MNISRREFLATATAAAAVADVTQATGAAGSSQGSNDKLRLIGVEEHYSIASAIEAMRAASHTLSSNLDLRFPYAIAAADLAQTEAALIDFETTRLADMDRTGVTMQILSLTAPGVQIYDARTASRLAREANERVAEVIGRHPQRFAALAALAPQDPSGAVQEMERAIRSSHFNGFIINSHTNGEYLDLPKFRPILEAAEALQRPIYIHPRSPSDSMAGPMVDYNMSGAVWGYGVEAGTHAVRLIMSGTLDRFPNLQIVLGHMGEAVPFWLARLDANAQPGSDPRQLNQRKPSEYFRQNFHIATTGVLDSLALRFCIEKIGADRILWSTDYPYAPARAAADFLRSAPIPEAQRQLIAHGNAEKLFHLAV